MFILELVVKYTPLPLSVQRKTAEDADALYKQIITAMNTGSPRILELTCEHQPDKKISVLSSEISALQLTEKSGTSASSGRPPGFFAIAAEAGNKGYNA